MANVEKCPCGHCNAWHVNPQAAVQGVYFSRPQAEAVAAVVNIMSGNFTDEEFWRVLNILSSAKRNPER
jgi:hypothetical protein